MNVDHRTLLYVARDGNDLSGHYEIECEGGIDLTLGKFDRAFVFTGQETLRASSPMEWDLTAGPRTIDVWIKPTLFKQKMSVFGQKDWTVYLGTNGSLGFEGWRHDIRTTGGLTGDWQHVCLTYNTEFVRVYLDGVQRLECQGRFFPQSLTAFGVYKYPYIGLMEGLRVSTGLRWESDFSVPVQLYDEDEFTAPAECEDCP